MRLAETLIVLAIAGIVASVTYGVGHDRGEKAAITEMREMYGTPPGHVLLDSMYFEGSPGDDRPAITVREDKYGASEVVLRDWHCRRSRNAPEAP